MKSNYEKIMTKIESYDLTKGNTSIFHGWLLYKILFSFTSGPI